MNPPLLALAATLIGILLASCGSTTQRPPPAGMAVIDVTPDLEKRDRLDRLRVVSVNGQQSRGTRQVLNPGVNTVRVGFKWPQGGNQEADLAFFATEGTIYAVHYEVHPPFVNRMNQSVPADRYVATTLDVASEMGEGAFLAVPPLLAFGSAAVAHRIGNTVAEESKPADYIDLIVTASHSREGIVRRVRTYPDGRVDPKPWARYAQMRHPR
ncbi:hypothetical protein [Haloferula helveola]